MSCTSFQKSFNAAMAIKYETIRIKNVAKVRITMKVERKYFNAGQYWAIWTDCEMISRDTIGKGWAIGHVIFLA